MSDIAIHVENLGKLYLIGERQRYKALRDTLTDALYAPFRAAASLLNGHNGHDRNVSSRLSASEFWALKQLSFDIKKGEVVGIIGRNGAGKSTLLKILSRITKPTDGYARIHGRVGSLLEVGTGFHPELTGRENIYLNGSIIGMKKNEIDRKFAEIVAFAEIEKFIDTPVKFYSSGMYVRLAFAVAAHLEPEILIVDEVLAVGDAAFQKKCLGKMQDVSTKQGRTVLFVSHNMGAVASLCSRGFWLDGGALRKMGPARFVIDEYLRRNGPDNNHTLNLFKMPRAFSPAGRLCLESFKWLCDVPLRHGEQVKALIQFQVASPLDDVSVGIGFSTIEGTRLLTYETDFPGGFRPSLSEPGTYSAQVEIDSLPLAPGNYVLDVGCRSGDAYALDYLPAATQLEIVPGPTTPGYIVRPDAGVRLASRWFWIS